MGGFSKSGYGGSYQTAPRPTEFIWAANLANLLIDCVDGAAALWKERALYGKVKPSTFEVFIQNFRSLAYHTSEYLHKEDHAIVDKAEVLFKSDLNFNTGFDKRAVDNALSIFGTYNKRIHHTKSIMKIIEELNVVVDSGG